MVQASNVAPAMIRRQRWQAVCGAILFGALSACGGGSGSSSAPPSSPPPPPAMGAADASRLLEQATFGVTASDVTHVQSVGLNAYVAEQLAQPASQYTGFAYTPHTAPASCRGDGSSPLDAASVCARDQYSAFQVQRAFFTHALGNPDQLRQRVAFALSQIFVVASDKIYEAYGMANFQNILLSDAFANFRTLLQDVTLSPSMGHYLDMVNSDAANAQNGTVPNQNYARELLQLFSIGLVELNQDGTVQVSASGAPVPTFEGPTIEGFSAVFTGWTYPPLAGAASQWTNPINLQGTMVSFPDHHQSGTKLLLNGVTVPAGQSPEQDLNDALDNVFNHPNVGPFIGKQLIQHLVTSNPSPGYVSRVAAVFAANSAGVRGDMGAVVTAILTDPEARGAAPATNAFGRLREPALFVTSTMRSLGGRSDGVLLRNASSAMGEPIYSPETVFSFFPPSYQIPGSADLGPEFGIANAATALARANFIYTVIMTLGAAPDPTVAGAIGTNINLATLPTGADSSTVVAALNQALMHGTLPADALAVITHAANTAAGASADPLMAARTAAYLILTSNQFQVER